MTNLISINTLRNQIMVSKYNFQSKGTGPLRNGWFYCLQRRMKWSEVKSLSRVRLFATPWTVDNQAPPSMGFSRQEYWSGVPLPSPVGSASGKELACQCRRQETWVLSRGQEDPLEKGMTTHSSILTWNIPWWKNLVGYSPWGCKESDTTEVT